MLKPLQATMPLGQFDFKDTELLSILGGEVVTFASVGININDKTAPDQLDGYVNATPAKRVYATRTVATTSRPLMLADDGINGYGTLFGSVVGGTVGQQVTGGAVLGPHTATGSGKVTLWSQPGLYAISLDAVDTASITPSNTSLATGDSLTYVPASSSGGQLTKVGSSAAASNTVVVANFVEFATNGSLVTTPNNLVGTFNPPDGALTTTAKAYTFAIVYFNV